MRERIDLSAIGAWLVPFALIFYLGLNNGGYDIVERSQAGVAVWWVVVVGTAVGLLPVAGGTTAGRVMFALLTLFALWTAVALSWTESAERSMIELARVATYLGFFALALGIQGGGRWRHVLNGTTAGAALVVALAVLSRLQPPWFPDQESLQFLGDPELVSRLAYPLNYSSGLSALAALTLPLLLAVTASARALWAPGLAAAAMPVVALALWLTGSSLAIPLSVLGLLTFLALAPDRLPKLASLLVAGGGAAVLIAAAGSRDALDRGRETPAALREGDELTLIAIAVCAGVALAQIGLVLARRRWQRPTVIVVPSRVAVGVLGAGAAVIVAVALAVGAPGELSEAWEDFKGLDRVEEGDAREAQILDVSSSGRYQYWVAAADANETEPLLGIGPGTFEFWWAREGSFPIFVRDAHSLYMEALAELGIIGLLLVLTFTLGVLCIGVARVFRSAGPVRLGLAAATAGSAVFVAGAAVDWMWELAVLPVAFASLAAVVVGGRGEHDARIASVACGAPRRVARDLPAVAMLVVAMAAVVVITVPLAGRLAIEESRDYAAAGRLDAALAEARVAQRLQPYASGPRVQEAAILEREGDLAGAVAAATAASRRESTDWRVWALLSRLEAERGHPGASVRAYRVARSLNPRLLP